MALRLPAFADNTDAYYQPAEIHDAVALFIFAKIQLRTPHRMVCLGNLIRCARIDEGRRHISANPPIGAA